MIPLKPAEEEPEDDAPKDATALQIEHDTLQEVMFYSSIVINIPPSPGSRLRCGGKRKKNGVK